MHKGYIKTAAILGALSVALGAFAAHTLKGSVSDYALEIFETSVRYQFYHVFALLAVGILYKEFPNKTMVWAGRLFIAGIILFSGSLYILGSHKSSGATRLQLDWRYYSFWWHLFYSWMDFSFCGLQKKITFCNFCLAKYLNIIYKQSLPGRLKNNIPFPIFVSHGNYPKKD